MSMPELTPGATVTVVWEANPRGGGIKANRINDARVSKIVLPSSNYRGSTPQPGQTWTCSVEKITNPRSERSGAIIVIPQTQRIDCSFEDVWIDPKQAELISTVLQSRKKNLFFEGLQGVGKSTIAGALASRLDWEFRKIHGSQIKKVRTMYGSTQQVLQPDGTAIWKWFDSPLVKMVREAKKQPHRQFLSMVDEYTRIDEDARDVFLEAIEGDHRALTLPTTEVLYIPDNIHWMAAGNVGDSFTVKDQDAANTDRWVVIEINHMPPERELAHCLRKYPQCPRQPMEKAMGTIDKLRKIIGSKMRLSNTISTRQTENVALLLAGGIDLEEALLTSVANQFRGKRSNENSERGRLCRTIRDALAGRDIA